MLHTRSQIVPSTSQVTLKPPHTRSQIVPSTSQVTLKPPQFVVPNVASSQPLFWSTVSFCCTMLCKCGICRHAVCVCLCVRHIRTFCQNE